MGLIESDWGGTPAQSWTSKEAIDSDAALKYVTDFWETVLAGHPAAKEKHDNTTLPAGNKDEEAARAGGGTPPNRPGLPPGPGHANTPAGLYNGMIAPLVPYGIRGAIWYQGESNATEREAYKYRRLFGAMFRSQHAGRAVQRHDCAARAVRHPRGDLVSGREQRDRAGGVQVPAAVRGHDRGLAQSMGARRFPFPVRATGQLQDQRVLAGVARIADGDAAPGQYRDGGDHRHRRFEEHSPDEQTGRGTAPGARGARADL